MTKNTYVFLLVIVVLGLAFWAYNSSKKEKTLPNGPATVSVLSVSNDTSSAAAVLAGTKTITWQTTNYPADAGVNINLIKKVSDSPRQFEAVRTLVTDTANDGQETWIPQTGENTDDLFIEVTCSGTYQFTAGCSLARDPIKVN